ncbi:glycan metabolism protein RagB [Mucilaginibacter sp. PPCGB 2223]|uniref:RagB/SusD family nutrient uptake outer membrane protein n=1 Tax=Mucilaginibacter sp. PPCGB 2223 TaxID=1886027 RepID=UPI0008271156|nr:RagB/SusD family nutrient uptake outer membrane protein [Mucilaginibacter sp. PPCGB 2223]OCX54380.1 glycan metabolism protein RagB [Mucilaginibacter sp. PPCGB 2223]
MKRIINQTIIIAALIMVSGCKKFLDYQPQGALSIDQASTPAQVDGLCTAAYAAIGNDFWDGPITSMWEYGSVRSDDAYKGGGSVSDQFQMDVYEQFYLLNPSNNGAGNDGFTATWTRCYGAISRADAALRALNSLTAAQFPNKTKRIGEMRFLRGHMFFLLKVLFKYIPYFDETLTNDQIAKVSNRQFTNDQLWDKIASDFQTAIADLPLTQPGEPGRANQLAAKAYLAKLRLYQAYTQDDKNNVTGIDATKLSQVVSLTNDVINSGIYRLNDDYAKNFLYGYDNGPESVFAIQYSINDGTAFGRLSMATSLNYFAGAPQYGCCAFHIPSQNLVNAFKTDVNGLPLFDTFNTPGTEMVNAADFQTNGVDPRLDHTIAIDGHPFKYNPAIPYSHSWERAAGIYGGFGTMKELQLATCACFSKVGPFYGTSVNLDIIRYDDVLLMQAEAQIELGNPAAALPLINQIRTRAANSTALLKNSSGNNPSNYRISTYLPGVNIPVWDQATARKALRFERRVEFAMESPRFFDLVRWGVAAETLNAYFAIEKSRRPFLTNAKFTKGTHEYFPIPQQEIQFTNGAYTQNNGY